MLGSYRSEVSVVLLSLKAPQLAKNGNSPYLFSNAQSPHDSAANASAMRTILTSLVDYALSRAVYKNCLSTASWRAMAKYRDCYAAADQLSGEFAGLGVDTIWCILLRHRARNLDRECVGSRCA